MNYQRPVFVRHKAECVFDDTALYRAARIKLPLTAAQQARKDERDRIAKREAERTAAYAAKFSWKD